MKIGTKIFMDICSERKGYMALSVYVYLCNTYPNRIITDTSYNKISKICGISWQTAKDAVTRLADHGALDIKDGVMHLHSLKKRRSNIDTTAAELDVYRFNRKNNRRYKTIKELRYLLMKISILNLNKRREYTRELMLTANPGEHDPVTVAEHKKAKAKLSGMGIAADATFNDAGLGYEAIKRELGCSNYLVRKINSTSPKRIYRCERRILCMDRKYLGMWRNLVDLFTIDEATEILKWAIFSEHEVRGSFFATGRNLYWVQANIYKPRRGMKEWYYDFRKMRNARRPKRMVA